MPSPHEGFPSSVACLTSRKSMVIFIRMVGSRTERLGRLEASAANRARGRVSTELTEHLSPCSIHLLTGAPFGRPLFEGSARKTPPFNSFKAQTQSKKKKLRKPPHLCWKLRLRRKDVKPRSPMKSPGFLNKEPHYTPTYIPWPPPVLFHGPPAHTVAFPRLAGHQR